jgi:DNA-binding transcriptional ArsR family regulator
MQQAGYAQAATVQAHDPASDPPRDAQLDAMFMALADPTRRAIIRRLTAGEATVTELARPFYMSQPAISKHVKVLERAGLVSRRRDAQRRPCRLEARRLRAATDWLDGYRRYWDESYDNLDAVLDDMAAEEAPADEAASGEPEAGGDGAAAPRSDS